MCVRGIKRKHDELITIKREDMTELLKKGKNRTVSLFSDTKK